MKSFVAIIQGRKSRRFYHVKIEAETLNRAISIGRKHAGPEDKLAQVKTISKRSAQT